MNDLRSIIRKLVAEELNEMTTTGNVQGYNTPYAFSNESTGSEKRGIAMQGRIAAGEGGHKDPAVFDYTLVENKWIAMNKDPMDPKLRIGQGLRNINTDLKRIDKFIKWYARLQSESDITNEDHWENTKKNANKIRRKLISMANNIREIC